jgi:hypothetical protein
VKCGAGERWGDHLDSSYEKCSRSTSEGEHELVKSSVGIAVQKALLEGRVGVTRRQER